MAFWAMARREEVPVTLPKLFESEVKFPLIIEKDYG
jgi:hypothetical protein